MHATARSSLVVILFAALAPTVDAAELTVFGDSYSIPVHNGSATWVTQLKQAGAVSTVHDFAHSGAVAATVGGNNFAAEIRRWQASGRPLGNTVVYLGCNDIGGDLSRSRAGYQAAINTLLAAGASAGPNHLLLVLPHDVGSTPLYNRSAAQRAAYRRATQQWDSFVRSVASHVHASVADLFSTIDRVLTNPRAEGFTNVTTADHASSATTALYDDVFHFGRHGQAIIARTIGARLVH